MKILLAINISMFNNYHIKTKQRVNNMTKINSYVMPIHNKNGSTVVSSVKGGDIAMKQRVARLKRELKRNTSC